MRSRDHLRYCPADCPPNSNIDPVEPLAIREIQGSSCVASYGTVQSASMPPVAPLSTDRLPSSHHGRLRLLQNGQEGDLGVLSHLIAILTLVHFAQNNILDTVDINSPPFIRQSHGLWLDVPASALEILLLKNLHPAASIHAAEHALMNLTPMIAMCTEGDVRTECKQPEKELASTPSSRKRPARSVV